MGRVRPGAARLLWTALVVVGLGCGGPEERVDGDAPVAPSFSQPQSFESFRAQARRIPGSPLYFVDGDTPLQDEQSLRDFYNRYVQPGALTINEDDQGLMTRWNDTTQRRLTYCVSKSFGASYNTVVQQLADAAGAWQQAAGIRFVHMASQDNNCTPLNARVLFDVRPAPSGTDPNIYAASFFPHFTRGSRTVWLNLRARWNTQGPPSVTGVLRHELGHVLGFRHEHVRPEAGGLCPELHSWLPLTPYDPYSVMHYPYCNGRGDGWLLLTDEDRLGAQSVYGPPYDGVSDDPLGASEDFTFDARQPVQSWKQHCAPGEERCPAREGW